MIFRHARSEDLSGVMQILGEGRATIKRLGIDQWQLGYPHEEIVAEDIRQGRSFVLEDNGALAGTAVALFTGEPVYDAIHGGAWITASSSQDPTYCTIHRVAVGEGFQGQGVARRLFAEIEQMTKERGYSSIRIDTHPGNAPMRGLLASLGYEECGIIYIDHAGENTPERIAYEKLVS